MITIGRGSIITTLSFSDTIPNSAAFDREYLREVRRGVQSLGVPVSLDVDEVKGGGVTTRTCLVVKPTDRRLRHYPTLHYAVKTGNALQVGFYLLGGDRATSGSLIGGQEFGIGVPTAADEANIEALVGAIFHHAVGPAIEAIALRANGGGDQRSGGFFGL